MICLVNILMRLPAKLIDRRRRSKDMAWTDERVELLKKLWSDGLSASQIANRMGGVTRNAVIGKVHRLGLSGRATPAKPQRGCASVPSLSVSPLTEEADDLEPLAAEPEFIAPATLSEGDMTTVATLTNRMCKWPIGDPTSDDFHFCGQPTPAGKSYCAYHARLAFQPSHRRAETAEPAPRRLSPIIEPTKQRATG